MKHIRFVPLSIIALGIMAANPVFAQDSSADAPATDDSTSATADSYADPAAADSTVSDDTAATDDSATPAADDSGTASDDSAATDETASAEPEEPAAPPRKPFYAYAGADYAFLHTSLSKDSLKNALGGDRFDSDFYRVRLGTRLFKQIGVEAQFGVKNQNGNDHDKVATKQMYGVYLVPTGNLFRFLEVSAPVGYSHLRLENSNGHVNFDAVSFGLNFEIPVFVRPDSRLPDVRIGGGGTVFFAESAARTYGYQAGIRFDFKI